MAATSELLGSLPLIAGKHSSVAMLGGVREGFDEADGSTCLATADLLNGGAKYPLGSDTRRFSLSGSDSARTGCIDRKSDLKASAEASSFFTSPSLANNKTAQSQRDVLLGQVPVAADSQEATGMLNIESAGGHIVNLSDETSFVYGSAAMTRIHAQAATVARFDIPILILGESGVGKEVIAQLIHTLSPRAAKPFLKVNCAAVPAELLESELFGYEAGAFTGATKMKPGKFEQCEGGTILLDEIGEMAPALQAKLLHVLQDHRFSRLGSRTTTKADVRILAATNVSIEEAIASKSLRPDLYYRLNGFSVTVPPLRDRKTEIPLLIEHFMRRTTERFGVPRRSFSSVLMHACVDFSWPGNLRQLQNFVMRHLILGDEEMALAEVQAGPSGANPVLSLPTASINSGLKDMSRSVKNQAEADVIARCLGDNNWHRGKTAESLQISYKALLYKIKHYRLQPPPRA